MIDANEVKSWFEEIEDLDDLDLGYLSVEDTIELNTAPSGYVLEVVAENTDRDYDSYGNRMLDSGYIVFSVTDPDGNSENFKLPMSYASYDGWSYAVDEIAPTVQREKVITTWELV